ncbi:1-deoxy-D-xylulose-5-phosphate reductoisomerase [Desulfatiglans anilini]|uniref:1-deoxy-D-xylulose-5-phosphate reductoisomerase n=1 Tax=Desulfatiglans anilini TaxID=90728 RepID=UPI00040EDF3E|nr:1-deoxy-D-xylulose-5-phosphate reductoisomerase [Desulfatiglans anilini]
MMNIALLGSTGSIGVNVLNVIRRNPGLYRIQALGAGTNIDLLLAQTEEFKPRTVVLRDADLAVAFRDRLPSHLQPEVLHGTTGLLAVVRRGETDTVISAISGAAGLMPTYEAVRCAKNVALANKETMVMAGPLVMRLAREKGVWIRPIDSEHSAIFQALQGHRRKDVRRVILTASGGPFRSASHASLTRVTPAQALDHPNWRMGPKISIDSATLMNKGLEIIEALWLFDLAIEQIDVLVHPQSIVHSMVEYADGSVIAQMGIPDMVIPIAYALSHPAHLPTGLPSLDLSRTGPLTFEAPDMQTFPCLRLAIEAARAGGSLPAVLNGANEVAVEAFLNGRIGFLDIPSVIERTMHAHHPFPIDTIEQVLEADLWARRTAGRMIESVPLPSDTVPGSQNLQDSRI